MVPPRLHDLRHSFAVRDASSGGIARATAIRPHGSWHLSTFLGHVDLASTAVYLTITPELLDAANARFAQLAAALALAATPPSAEDTV